MSSRRSTDHLGNEYPSIRAMCRAYGISIGTYRDRIHKCGMTVEEALTRKPKNNKGIICTDPDGNRYSSEREMCRALGVHFNTYRDRTRRAGMSTEAALLLRGRKKREGKGKACTDHLGNKYPSVSAMCRAYGVLSCTYKGRIKAGMSVEDALTCKRKKRVVNGKPCKDHHGNEFPSKKAMCRVYGINYCTYEARLKAGMTVEDALTRKKSATGGKPCKDYYGNEFPSVSAMCRAHGINNRTYQNRRAAGMSVEDALTGEDRRGKHITGNPCTDHLGNEYSTQKAMCRAYGIRDFTYSRRIERGWSLEEALTGVRKKEPKPEKEKRYVTDHKGNKFRSEKKMCKYYGVKYSTYMRRKKKYGDDLQKILESPLFWDRTPARSVVSTDHLGNQYPSLKAMCKHYGVSVSAYLARIKDYNWSVEKALTTPIRVQQNGVTDHLGNHFGTLKEMCDCYNVKLSTYKARIGRGCTKQEALAAGTYKPGKKKVHIM